MLIQYSIFSYGMPKKYMVSNLEQVKYRQRCILGSYLRTHVLTAGTPNLGSIVAFGLVCFERLMMTVNKIFDKRDKVMWVASLDELMN